MLCLCPQGAPNARTYLFAANFVTHVSRWLVYQEPLQDEQEFHHAHVVPVVKQVLDVVAQNEQAQARGSKENNPRHCLEHGRAQEVQLGMAFKESIEIDGVQILRSSTTKRQPDLNSRMFDNGYGSQKAAHAEGSPASLKRASFANSPHRDAAMRETARSGR
jgi:hypothetical protein